MMDFSSPLVMAMIQPPALPGSYRYDGRGIADSAKKALEETEQVAALGFDGIILQNMNDMPIRQHSRPEAIAYMTRIAQEIKLRFPQLKLGILVNWDGVAALAVADAVGADFIRVEHLFTRAEVTSAGLLQAQCCEILELRRRIGSRIPIYADIYESHGEHLGKIPVADAAWEAVNEAFADGLFLGGKNDAERLQVCRQVKARVNVPCLLSGGATADNIANLLQIYDGVSVATWIKGGDMKNPIDSIRAKRFLQNARGAARKDE